jgi:hypothetical protein
MRPKVNEYVQPLNSTLRPHSAKVLAYAGPSGNLPIDVGDLSLDVLNRLLSETSGYRWSASLNIQVLSEAADTARSGCCSTSASSGHAVEPGLVVTLDAASVRGGLLVSKNRAAIAPSGIDGVAFGWQCRIKGEVNGTWGAVAEAPEKTYGGSWTARSRRNLDVLVCRSVVGRRSAPERSQSVFSVKVSPGCQYLTTGNPPVPMCTSTAMRPATEPAP